MKNSITYITFLLALNLSYGQSFFSNEITDTNPSLNNPYTNGQIVDPNITVTGIGRSSGITPTTAGNRYAAVGWNNVPFDNQKYFEFTITPNAGYEIDFNSFEYTSEKSHEWLDSFGIRSSVDGFTSDIGTPTIGSNTIDLSSVIYQNISSAITFRVYAWGLTSSNGSFSINDFTFNGIVATTPCTATVTWNGTNWNSTNSLAKTAIINDNYDTSNGGAQVSFSACRLIVNPGFTLTIDNGDYIEIQNDIIADGDIIVRPQGAVIQIDDTGTVMENGTITVEKLTAPLNVWYEYTYWSSPVSEETIGGALSEADQDRRFWFDGSKYLDATAETGNNNDVATGQDDVDDDNNDWQYATAETVMIPGVGYAATHSDIAFTIFPGDTQPYQKQFKYTFEGPFNTGTITVPIYRNDEETQDNNWNLIGNPYPSAIDVDLFLAANSGIDTTVVTSESIDGAVFLWSQNTELSSTNNGNQNLNFDTSDYAIINGTATSAGGDGEIPARFIPSGQSFFISMSDTAPSTVYSEGDPLVAGDIVKTDIIFNNSMRVKGATDNSQFFKATNSKPSDATNKVWFNLTSDNGVFNQAVIGYVTGATNAYDGMYYDAPRNLSTGASAIIYTTIDGSNKKFAIQGKAVNSLNDDDVIIIGFKTSIDVPTIYTLSIAQIEGDFLTTNPVFIKDNLLNKLHDLKTSDYNFTSEIGEFNERFEIVFNEDALSLGEYNVNNNGLSIIELKNGNVQFKISENLEMISIQIMDLQGKLVYTFKTTGNDNTYNLSNLSIAPYIAKVTLVDGYVITKKTIKRY